VKAGSLPTIVVAPNSAGRWFCHQYSLSDHGKSEWALIMDMAEGEKTARILETAT
jgi:hypothetical protein